MVSVNNPKGLSPKILPFCIYCLKEDKENILTGGFFVLKQLSTLVSLKFVRNN